MKTIAKKTILNIQPYIPGKPIEEVKRELKLNDVIKLASNENPFPPSPKVLKAISEAAKNVNRYPDGGCHYLREALVKQLNLKPNQLIFGNGSDELIVLAIKAFVDPRDEVIIAKPSFLIYDLASRIAGAKVKAVSLKNFYYDLDSMRNSVNAKTKIIFLGNPDNPAGTYIPDYELKDFINSVPSNILIFIDEAYFEFVKSKDYGKSLDLIARHKNIIISRTFSKMYGLAGLRIGYAAANEELIDILNRIREPFNVNSIAQAAALACLEDKAYYRWVALEMEKGKKYLYQELTKLDVDYVESFTNFILIKISTASEITRKLMRMGIIVRDMNPWGLSNYFRVSIGTAEENKKFIQGLSKIVRS